MDENPILKKKEKPLPQRKQTPIQNKMVTQIHNKHYQRSDELGKKKDNFGGVENVAKVINPPDTHLQLNN